MVKRNKYMNVPEIRFKGLDKTWNKKTLDELVQLNSGMDYKHLCNGNIPVYGTGGYMLSVNAALSYDKDAIGIGRKGTINKPYIKHLFGLLIHSFMQYLVNIITYNFVIAYFKELIG